MAIIHNTAIVSKSAKIGKNCNIGAYCIVGDKVVLQDGVILKSHVVVDGDTIIGENTILYPYASVGLDPQDLKFKGEDTKTIIGKNCKIREHATIHKGTADSDGITQIGDNCLIMVGVHVAHDVKMGNGVIISNNVLLAGHVILEDLVSIGGGCAVHQFCRIGEATFIGGFSTVTEDIVPFALYTGVRDLAEINGVNLVGLKRKGYKLDEVQAIGAAYKVLFSKDNLMADNIIKLKELVNNYESIAKIYHFVSSPKSRALFTKYRMKN
jgi:UDP-N-acetylglucosamine acyltransferase